MKYFISFLALIISFNSFGQVAIIDSVHCTDVTMTAAVTGGLIPISSGITADDNWSAVIPIGFTFNFYGVPYTQCIIGSNGELGFQLANALAFNTWSISNTLLGSTGSAPDVINCICGPWSDIYIPAGGTIMYSTVGTAPNRRFEVTFCGTAMYSCTTQWVTTQIIIYETSDLAEVHIGHHTFCTSWNGGYAEVGVKNAAGTLATVAPGRDYPSNWNATDEAWRFTPGGGTYAVSSIAYSPIPYAASSIYWYDSTTGAYLGMGSSLTVAPVIGTTYIACALGCLDTVKAYMYIDPALFITSGGLPNIDNITFTSPTVCGKCDGTITLYGINPGQIDTLFYTFGGVAQPPVTTTASIDSIIRITGLCVGTYDHLFVKVGNCPSNIVGPVTLTTPPLGIDLNYSIKYGCRGDAVFFNNLSAPSGSSYTSAWDFGDGTTGTDINPLHIFYPQGVYTIKFTYGTTYGCSVDTTFAVTLQHPLAPAFSTNVDTICLGTPIYFTNLSTSPNEPTYSWNFGDGSPRDTTENTAYTYAAGGDYQAVLTVTDTIGCDSTASEWIRVVYLTAHTSVPDTSICIYDSMVLHTYYTLVPPNNDSMDFQWFPKNNLGAVNIADAHFSGTGTFTYSFTATAYPSMIQIPLGCSVHDTEMIHSYPPVTLLDLTASQTIPAGGSVHLNADGATYYTWKPDNGTLNNPNINNPIATPTDSVTVYTVSGMNLYGCLDSATITIRVVYDVPDDLPTGFTPNGDGLNDVFKLTNLKLQKLVDFSVYNRWGQQLFSTSNPEKGWDGTFNGVPQDIGVYNYQVIIAHPDGSNTAYRGEVTLIR